MAIARLVNPEATDGGTAFQVQTYPFSAPPFAGSDDRNWTNFVVVSDYEATWEWRTGADHVRRAAHRLASGIWTIEQAMDDEDVSRWVNRNAEEFIEAFRDEEPGLADLPDGEFTSKMLLRVGQDLTNAAAPFSYYLEDDDACASDAAYALELPRWAERDMWSAGGPGSGYEAMSIVVAEGKTLHDLARWLENRLMRALGRP